MAAVLRRNIEALRERREADARRASWSDRLAQRITDFAGSMAFALLHLVLFGGWISVNLAGPASLRFDPTLVVLAMAASVEAIFLSTFVLISQNRMAAAQDERAELDLQINLLAEHEVTRLIDLVTRLAERLDLAPTDPDLDELRRDVAPDAVLDRIAESKETKHD
jgi:uncharacterized membrane protein